MHPSRETEPLPLAALSWLVRDRTSFSTDDRRVNPDGGLVVSVTAGAGDAGPGGVDVAGRCRRGSGRRRPVPIRAPPARHHRLLRPRVPAPSAPAAPSLPTVGDGAAASRGLGAHRRRRPEPSSSPRPRRCRSRRLRHFRRRPNWPPRGPATTTSDAGPATGSGSSTANVSPADEEGGEGDEEENGPGPDGRKRRCREVDDDARAGDPGATPRRSSPAACAAASRRRRRCRRRGRRSWARRGRAGCGHRPSMWAANSSGKARRMLPSISCSSTGR